MSTVDVLKFAESFSIEDNVIVWRELLGNLMQIVQITIDQEYNPHIASFIRQLVTPISKKLGWKPIQGESKYAKKNKK